MRPSRGMGDINPSKMPKTKKAKRRDDADTFTQFAEGGLYENIHAKRARIKAGSGEKMRKPGSKGAPSEADFIKASRTRKK